MLWLVLSEMEIRFAKAIYEGSFFLLKCTQRLIVRS